MASLYCSGCKLFSSHSLQPSVDAGLPSDTNISNHLRFNPSCCDVRKSLEICSKSTDNQLHNKHQDMAELTKALAFQHGSSKQKLRHVGTTCCNGTDPVAKDHTVRS